MQWIKRMVCSVGLLMSVLLIGGGCGANAYYNGPLPMKRPNLNSMVRDKNDTTKEEGAWMNNLDLRTLTEYGVYNEALRDSLIKQRR
jgi:hypothetical protein